MLPARDGKFGSMSKGQAFSTCNFSRAQQMRHVAIEADLSQADDDAQIAQQCDFLIQKRSAVPYLLRQRFVAGRCATDYRTDPESLQLHPVVARPGVRLGSEPGGMEYRVQKISRAVAGERPSGAVRAMRAGCQAQRQHACVHVAEGGYRFAPVFPIGVGLSLDARNFLTVGAQPRTSLAGDDAGGKFRECGVDLNRIGCGTVGRVALPFSRDCRRTYTGHIKNCTIRIPYRVSGALFPKGIDGLPRCFAGTASARSFASGRGTIRVARRWHCSGTL